MPIERIIFTLDGLRRHWLLFLLPLLIALPIAAAAWKLVPKKYEVKSTILMISANRGLDGTGGSSGFPRQSALDQIAVLEAWLKSDHLMAELLPQLVDDPAPMTPEEMSIQTNILRRSLTLQLVGAAVLEIQLEGAQAKGLGRKLEIIVTRLLEGVLNPESGILSAAQLIIARRDAALREAEAALSHEIALAKLGSSDQVLLRLQALSALKREYQGYTNRRPRGDNDGDAAGSPATPAAGSSDQRIAELTQKIERTRADIAGDPAVVEMLERQYQALEEARAANREINERTGASQSSYVRVFDAPERLTVIGRPRDPLIGTSPGRKYAIAIMFLAGLLSLGLVGLAVLLDPRLRIGEDFEHASGLPVIARLGKIL
jgi:hypothetical protein